MIIPPRADPASVVARLHRAQNLHDIDAFVACFAPDYQSARPGHAGLTSRGNEQVRSNWAGVFQAIPDFQAEMLRTYATGDTAWTEWRWHGTPAAGDRFDWHGITLFRIQDGQITWGHFYMEPAETPDRDAGDL